ncbi:MAG: Fic family protein [Prevotellaceae bacterium]|nr:Fic family protein [Prevotellaceae bacterium]
MHIHPFRDGNGRIARLLEKWFIAEKLGKQFWEIPMVTLPVNSEYVKYMNDQIENRGLKFWNLEISCTFVA